MTLVIDNRDKLQDQPGFHALIAGVSVYPHVTGGAPAAALSACKIYHWLIEQQNTLTAPLATVRLLLSPSQEETELEPDLHSRESLEACSRSNFKHAIYDWREDASSKEGNVTFFYFSGQGVGIYDNDVLLLLEDFGNPRYPVLRNAVGFGNIYNGMTVSPSRRAMARTQFYFIDTERRFWRELISKPNVPAVFDVELGARDDRSAPIFYAAIPGSAAYTSPGKGSIFTNALLDCLEGPAVDPTGEYRENQMLWRVSVLSLNRALESAFDKMKREREKRGLQELQAYALGGLVKDTTICLIDKPPPVGLVFDARAELGDQPGLHALIVGISSYPHLPGGIGAPSPYSFGMEQLHSAAISAYRTYQWLLKNSQCFPVPLSTIRLLIVPSVDEIEAEPEMQDLEQVEQSCTLAKFLAAATRWRTDSSTHKDNMTLFYFVGHGAERQRKGDSVLFMEDFADGIGGTLRNAVDIENLFNGMAPSPSNNDIARIQLYFIDACRALPSEFQKFEWMNTTPVFNVELGERDDRHAPIFFASVPGDYAYGLKGKQTLFNKALMYCLDESAIVHDKQVGSIRRQVTIDSLYKSLESYIDQQNKEFNAAQDYVVSGLIKNTVICSWEEN